MLARVVNHNWEACPGKDITQALVHPCRWKRHRWDHGARIPFATVGGRGAVERAGREDERGGLSRFGLQRCVIPYSCSGVYLSVLEQATEGNLSKRSKIPL